MPFKLLMTFPIVTYTHGVLSADVNHNYFLPLYHQFCLFGFTINFFDSTVYFMVPRYFVCLYLEL